MWSVRRHTTRLAHIRLFTLHGASLVILFYWGILVPILHPRFRFVMFQDLDDVGWRQEPIDDEHLPIRRHRAVATPPLGN